MSWRFRPVIWGLGRQTLQLLSCRAPKSSVRLLPPTVCEAPASQNIRRLSRVSADDLRHQRPRKGEAFRHRNLRWMDAIPRALMCKARNPASFEDALRSFRKRGKHSCRRESRRTEKIQWHIDDKRWIVQNANRRFEPVSPFLPQECIVHSCANHRRLEARETAGQPQKEQKPRPISGCSGQSIVTNCL